MGYKLYREVRDHAPGDWTSGEVVVAWVIADDANDVTRQSWIPLAELCFRARLAPSSVRAALAKLAGRGFEFRVPHGCGRDGRPVFATRGHAMDYLVPVIHKGASGLAAKPVDNPPKGASGLAAMDGRKALAEAGKALAEPPKGASRLAPLSSDPLTISSDIDSPVVTTSVEGALSPVDNQRTRNGHWLDPAGEALRQVAESRAARAAREHV